MKPAVVLTDDQAEEFLRCLEGGGGNKTACKNLGVPLSAVKTYRDTDMAAGGDFYRRWSLSSGTPSSNSVTAEMEVLRKKIFEGAGELDRFLELITKTPMWARFEINEKLGRRQVAEVSHENHEGQKDWDINPDWRDVRMFNMRYVLPTLVPKLAVAQVKIERGTASRSQQEVVADGKMIFEAIRTLVQEEARKAEFQRNELATIEAPAD